MLEGFFNLSGFPSDKVSKGTLDIKKYFGVTLPNMIYNNDKNMDLVKLTETADVRTQKSESVLKNDWKKGLGGIGDTLAAKQAACESVGNGDQFDHLSSLSSTEDMKSRVRCGWIYNNTNPNNGRGAFGNSQGPFKQNAQGAWMWNLNAAKEKYHTSICSKVQDCPDIDSTMYKQRCGWCTKSGKAVPIVNKGVAYPYNTNNACPANQLITQGSKCPPPPPVSDPTQPRAPGEVCTPLQNGAVPRDCLIAKVTAAGCSDKGALSQALKSGSNNDYTSVLRGEKAFSIFQERATIPLDATGIKTGKISITDALNGFSRVQDLSASNANNGLNYAARDLCLNKGALNEFDFCSEIKDTTLGPFTLECLQNLFMKMGGQKAGVSYPNTGNVAFYNKFENWGKVKQYIQGLFNKTRSKDRKQQEDGMSEFYGIKMQNKSNPLPYGPEIAWKGKQVKISCERPVSIPNDYISAGCVNDDEMLDKWAIKNGYTMGTPPPSSPYKKYPGLDWAGNDIKCMPNKSIDECSEMCTKDGNCIGFCNIKGDYKGCCIKHNMSNRTEHPNGFIDFYIKQPLQCKAPHGNPPAEVAGWKYKGCWRDCHKGRGLTTRLPNVKTLEKCIEQAKAAKFKTAGIQYFGECWAGNNTDWDKMGYAGCCEPLGGNCTQQIYSSQ